MAKSNHGTARKKEEEKRELVNRGRQLARVHGKETKLDFEQCTRDATPKRTRSDTGNSPGSVAWTENTPGLPTRVRWVTPWRTPCHSPAEWHLRCELLAVCVSRTFASVHGLSEWLASLLFDYFLLSFGGSVKNWNESLWVYIFQREKIWHYLFAGNRHS